MQTKHGYRDHHHFAKVGLADVTVAGICKDKKRDPFFKRVGKAIATELRLRWGLYLLLLPTLIYVLVFLYGPMGGVVMAFQNYKASKGLLGSQWVGLKHFHKFFSSYNFSMLMKNTVSISLYSLAAGFPLPIIFALSLNVLSNQRTKNTIKTIAYAPHFISTVVVVGMINLFFAPTSGIFTAILNLVRGAFHLDPITLDWLTDKNMFIHLYVWSGIWQELGWGSIIYLAALSSINPDLYEAAHIDGATRLKCILHIDLPSILPTVITLLILNTGNILSVGYEKAYLMQNNLNVEASEIISTYVYKIGLKDAQYSYSAAIGMFNSVINLFFLAVVNTLSKKMADVSIF